MNKHDLKYLYQVLLGLPCWEEGNYLKVRIPLVCEDWFCSALQVSIGLIEILADHGGVESRFLDSHDLETMCSVFFTLVGCACYQDYIDLVKYATTWMHARSLQQAVLPTAPASWTGGAPYLFTGSIRKVIRERIISGLRPKNQHLFWSIAQVKRCASVVPPEFIMASQEKHAATISRMGKECSEDFLSRFKPRLLAIVNRMEFPRLDVVHEYSSNACYENARCNGGAKQAMLGRRFYNKKGKSGKRGKKWREDYQYARACEFEAGLIPKSYDNWKADSLLAWYSPDPEAVPYLEEAGRRLKNPDDFDAFWEELYGSDTPIDRATYTEKRGLVEDADCSDDNLLKMDYCPYIGVTERRGYQPHEFHQLLSSSMDSDGDGFCCAKVYSVLEPLKVRNITAGNAVEYSIAKAMQKGMHSSLKALAPFRLIGTPLTEEIVSEFMSNGGRCRSDGRWIASGDFSAATDNISIQLTKLVLCAMINKILTEDKSFVKLSDRDHQAYVTLIYERVLYEHRIEYGPFGPEPVMQRNGQLMGSNLSFPVLCIINLIVYWLCVEPDTVDFRKLNVLVNGDDIMFKCDNAQYQAWLGTLHEAGLTPSAGKNFFHWKYGTVNSALFYQGRGGYHKTRYIPFFNVGMLLGQSKVASAEDRFKPIHCLHQAVLHGANNKNRADRRFIVYNNEELKKSVTLPNGMCLNYYIPATMGGLGMKLPPGVKLSLSPKSDSERGVSRYQLTLAHSLRSAWYAEGRTKPPFRPIGTKVELGCEAHVEDIRKRVEMKVQLASCPLLPDAAPVKTVLHPANWQMTATQQPEESLAFSFRGCEFKNLMKMCESDITAAELKHARRIVTGKELWSGCKDDSQYKMLSPDNPHLYEELQVYRKCVDRRSRLYRLISEEKGELDFEKECQDFFGSEGSNWQRVTGDERYTDQQYKNPLIDHRLPDHEYSDGYDIDVDADLAKSEYCGKDEFVEDLTVFGIEPNPGPAFFSENGREIIIAATEQSWLWVEYSEIFAGQSDEATIISYPVQDGLIWRMIVRRPAVFYFIDGTVQ